MTTGQGAKPALMMVGAMLMIGIVDSYIVLLSQYIGLWQFHAARSSVGLPLILVVAGLGFATLRMKRPWWVLARSVALGLSMLCYFGALGIMPVAEALAGQFTHPLFVLLLTMCLTGQRVGPLRALATLAGFGGVLMVLQPDPADFDPMILLPILGGFFYAVSAMLTRYRCVEESTLVLLFGVFAVLGLMGGIGLLIADDPQGDFLSRSWVWPMGPAGWVVMLQALGSLVAVFCIIRSYQIGEPSRMAVFEYSVMIFGPLYAWAVFGQGLNLWQIGGIAVIAGAGIVIALLPVRGAGHLS